MLGNGIDRVGFEFILVGFGFFESYEEGEKGI